MTFDPFGDFETRGYLRNLAFIEAVILGASEASLEGWPRIVAHPSKRAQERAPPATTAKPLREDDEGA